MHSSPFVRRLALLAAALAAPAGLAAQARAAAAATPGAAASAAPAAASFTYRFRIAEDGKGETKRGTVHVAGASRVELDRRDGRDRDWFLVSADGRTITSVSPRKREWRQMPASEFEEIVGTALRSVRGIVEFELVGRATIDYQRLGAGETIAGLRTQKIRVIETFTVRPRVFGLKTDPERHRVTTTYWVTSDLAIPRNPLVALMTGAQTALAQQDEEYATKSRALRERLFTGAPVRVEVVSEEEDGGRERSTAEILELRRGPVDRALLTVPAGYRQREGRGVEVEL